MPDSVEQTVSKGEPETVADVLADVRYKAQHTEYVTCGEWFEIAERLAAAHAREIADLLEVDLQSDLLTAKATIEALKAEVALLKYERDNRP